MSDTFSIEACFALVNCDWIVHNEDTAGFVCRSYWAGSVGSYRFCITLFAGFACLYESFVCQYPVSGLWKAKVNSFFVHCFHFCFGHQNEPIQDSFRNVSNFFWIPRILLILVRRLDLLWGVFPWIVTSRAFIYGIDLVFVSVTGTVSLVSVTLYVIHLVL